MERTQSASQRLHESALAQGGFFTARQARDAGYADNVHPYHVRTGHWIREIRGVYRLAQFPLGTRPELMLWQLWSRNRQDEPQGVFSHATALSLHDLTDLMPAKLDITVPRGFRRMAAIPEVLRLHHAKLAAREIETVSGVRVTTVRRTLIDIIVQGAIAPEMQVQAVDQAIRRGLILRRELESARVSTRARRRIARILKLVPDDRPKRYATANALRTALEARLYDRARRDGVDLQRLRRQVAFDRLLARMFDPSHAAGDCWVLKGGYALELRFREARSTKDLDLTVRRQEVRAGAVSDSSPASLRHRLQIAMATPRADFFTFVVGETMAELTNCPEGGARFPVDVRLDGRTFVAFHVDLATATSGVGEAIRGAGG